MIIVKLQNSLENLVEYLLETWKKSVLVWVLANLVILVVVLRMQSEAFVILKMHVYFPQALWVASCGFQPTKAAIIRITDSDKQEKRRASRTLTYNFDCVWLFTYTLHEYAIHAYKDCESRWMISNAHNMLQPNAPVLHSCTKYTNHSKC